MEKKRNNIPSHILEKWETEAFLQKIPYTEFGTFIKMKEKRYLQSIEDKKECPQIFANDARNKLTDFGQEIALKTLLTIPEIERTCKFARFDFEELSKTLAKGFRSDEQKENFLNQRKIWFSHLKDRMRDLRISKETLKSFGLDWNAAKRFAYQTI